MLKKQWLMIIIIFVISIYQINCNKNQTDAKPAPTKKITEGLFVNITADPSSEHGKHRVGMGLSIAKKAIKSGRKVIVFFNIKGVQVPLKSSEDFSFAAHGQTFPKSKTALKELLDAGAIVMVCPSCLKASGHKKEELLDGVQLGDLDKFYQFADKILSLSY